MQLSVNVECNRQEIFQQNSIDRASDKKTEPILTAPSACLSWTPTIILTGTVYFRVKFCAILFLDGLAGLQDPG